MKTAMLGLLAETPIHPGSGRSLGVVDLPVAREAATDYPVLVGSSLKGALCDRATSRFPEGRVKEIFGEPDRAGELFIGDARLLLLPVRSLTSSYRWTTCPYLIERFSRDLARAGLTPRPAVPEIGQGKVMTAGNGVLFLEERQFEITGAPPDDLITALETLVLHAETRKRLACQAAILADEDFAWFASCGLPIQARNVLDDETKTSDNLWYEESLPPDTLMYSLISARSDSALDVLSALFPPDSPYIQVGGNETVGQGWFAVRLPNAQGGEA
ncbi:MAG: type III-B CRISPR module RAMP protein Cmr4 [Acidobacteriota bacterium]|nr:type III-B CRISPR module RAMP protein Cmr4 [Acidobacteriota bacterium]